MALSLLSSDEKIQVTLNGAENKETTIYFDNKQNLINLPIYTQEDISISGQVKLNFGKKVFNHAGIFVQLIGETETYHEKDSPEIFLFQTKELEPASTLNPTGVYDFNFTQFAKLYETYYGLSGRVRYYVRAMICRDMSSPIQADCEFAVHLPLVAIMYNQGFEIQLRIADYLMIDVELNKTNLHLDECLVGKITIDQIKLLIKRIQVSLVRREVYCPTPELTCTKEDVLTKIDLANKCPKKGDMIPFKINMASLEVSPSLMQCNPKIVTKYVLILSFIDEADRSLFKPVELNMWRRK